MHCVNDIKIGKIGKKATRSELLMKIGAGLCLSGKQSHIAQVGNNHYKCVHNGKNNGTNEDISIHAEMVVIAEFIRKLQLRGVSNVMIRRKLKAMTLVVARVINKNDERGYVFGNAYPCNECLNAIKDYGIKKIVCTNALGIPECKKDKYYAFWNYY